MGPRFVVTEGAGPSPSRSVRAVLAGGRGVGSIGQGLSKRVERAAKKIQYPVRPTRTVLHHARKPNGNRLFEKRRDHHSHRGRQARRAAAPPILFERYANTIAQLLQPPEFYCSASRLFLSLLPSRFHHFFWLIFFSVTGLTTLAAALDYPAICSGHSTEVPTGTWLLLAPPSRLTSATCPMESQSRSSAGALRDDVPTNGGWNQAIASKLECFSFLDFATSRYRSSLFAQPERLHQVPARYPAWETGAQAWSSVDSMTLSSRNQGTCSLQQGYNGNSPDGHSALYSSKPTQRHLNCLFVNLDLPREDRLPIFYRPLPSIDPPRRRKLHRL
jgi:hypothetical protein